LDEPWTVYRVCLLWSQQSNLMESHWYGALWLASWTVFHWRVATGWEISSRILLSMKHGELGPILPKTCNFESCPKLRRFKLSTVAMFSFFDQINIVFIEMLVLCFFFFFFLSCQIFIFWKFCKDFELVCEKVILYLDEDYFRQMICKGMLWTFGTFPM